MSKITFLGTASAVPDAKHQNTHFIVEGGEKVVLVDCPGNPFIRLNQAQIDPLTITDLILTHFHPDHVSGLPLFLMDLWLMKRKAPLAIYGLDVVLDKSKQLLALYDWEDWAGFYPINFINIPNKAGSQLLDTEGIRILTSPACHLIPSIGIKVCFPQGSICYSGDTAPCDEIVRLAEGCHILIHEATGEERGHSSPGAAGEIAMAAGVQKLYLIHYPYDSDPQVLMKETKAHFSGDVFIAEDLMTVEI